MRNTLILLDMIFLNERKDRGIEETPFRTMKPAAAPISRRSTSSKSPAAKRVRFCYVASPLDHERNFCMSTAPSRWATA